MTFYVPCPEVSRSVDLFKETFCVPDLYMKFLTYLLSSIDHLRLYGLLTARANNLFLFSFVALNSYHDPDDLSGTFCSSFRNGQWKLRLPKQLPEQTAFVFHQFTLRVVFMQIDTFRSSRCHQSLWLSDTHHFTSTSCKRWMNNHDILFLNDVKPLVQLISACCDHCCVYNERWSFHQVSTWRFWDVIPV